MATWAERFRHPGAETPPKPPDEHPTDSDLLQTWWRQRMVWDVYVKRVRQHEVARAIDDLDALKMRLGYLTPEQYIARNLGASWLDGSLTPPRLF